MRVEELLEKVKGETKKRQTAFMIKTGTWSAGFEHKLAVHLQITGYNQEKKKGFLRTYFALPGLCCVGLSRLRPLGS